MGKRVFIAEKPSVAREFAKALGLRDERGRNGYIEEGDTIITWCVGHLVTMSYPEVYDDSLKRWSVQTLPFLPEKFLYEVIPGVEKQFNIVKSLLCRSDVSDIYVCTDSGREGEYIYRLVEQEAGVSGKNRKRVWIDSQTEEEILRGIREAKDLSAYDNLAASAYLRAKEDYLIGINFSRILTLKYGNTLAGLLKKERAVISVGRVMTCVLGMIVRREREIRAFVKTPFYRVLSENLIGAETFEAEWKVSDTSAYVGHPDLYKENGWKDRNRAEELIGRLKTKQPLQAMVESKTKKIEKKAPPLLYNLAELQNDCSKIYKISPSETLKIVQELYEKKLVTYPRTDARVLSTAVAKEISRNIKGLSHLNWASGYAQEILAAGTYKNLMRTKYVNDKQITDHYAIIPTGQGFGALGSVPQIGKNVYELIVRRFLSIFYPPAVYDKMSLVLHMRHDKAGTNETYEEQFAANFRILKEQGYLKVAFVAKKKDDNEGKCSPELFEALNALKKGSVLPVNDLNIKEGETSPPNRYNSGSMILAMENAGQLIEDEELRAQIKGSGIGTSATRAEILQKLIRIDCVSLNSKTQILTPTLYGEMIYQVVDKSMKAMLNPELTASWEKGLTYVAEGQITSDEYMVKLEHFISSRTDGVMGLNNQNELQQCYRKAAQFYK